jgi:hypothetical protein
MNDVKPREAAQRYLTRNVWWVKNRKRRRKVDQGKEAVHYAEAA